MSCDEHCVSQALVCNGTRLASGTGYSTFKTTVAPYYTCAPPVLADCSAAAPGLDASGACRFRGSAANCPGTVSISDCDDAVATAAAHCAASHPSTQRFCSCDPAPTATPTTAPTAAPTQASTTAPSGARIRRGVTSAASAVVSPHRVLTLGGVILGSLAALGGGGGSRAGTGTTFAVAVGLALWASPVSGHNWIMSPSRAMTEASTTAPCRGRKSATDWHAQVGTGQDFVVKWATGHERVVYWVYVAHTAPSPLLSPISSTLQRFHRNMYVAVYICIGSHMRISFC
jgi:hypothetical protein